MTPAEKAAKAKRPRKRPGELAAMGRRKVWACRLREKREALRLSLRDVAAGTGLTVCTVHQIEAGVNLRLDSAFALAEFFGCTVPDLWPARLKGAGP